MGLIEGNPFEFYYDFKGEWIQDGGREFGISSKDFIDATFDAWKLDLSKPENIIQLIDALTKLADQLDTLYTTTAPNGNISAKRGRVALYNNSGTYTTWINTDGTATWQQISAEP